MSQPPVSLNTTFIGADGWPSHADVLWQVGLKDGEKAFVLLEHKSTRDPGTGRQMGRYIAHMFSRQLEEGTRLDDLDPIWPILIYNGAESWGGPIRVGKGGELAITGGYAHQIRVTDLASIPLHQLPQNVRVRACLRALALAGSRAMCIAEDAEAFAKAIAMGTDFGHRLGRYVASNVRMPEGLLEKALAAVTGKDEARKMADTIAGRLKIELFLDQARKQFGELADRLVKLVRNADGSQVEAWLDRLRGAPSLEYVLETENARREVADMALQLACAATERTGDGSAHGGNLQMDSIRRLLSDAVKADGIDGSAVQRKAYMIAATRAEAELRAAAADRIFKVEHAEEQARFGEEPEGTDLEQRLEWRQAVDAGLAEIRRKGVEPTAAELVAARTVVFAEGTGHEPLAEALARTLERGPLERTVETIRKDRAQLAGGLMTEWTPTEDAGHHSKCRGLFRSFAAPEIWAMANGRTDGIREFPANADGSVVEKNVQTLLLSAGTGPAAWHRTARSMAQELGIRMDHSREHGIEPGM